MVGRQTSKAKSLLTRCLRRHLTSCRSGSSTGPMRFGLRERSGLGNGNFAGLGRAEGPVGVKAEFEAGAAADVIDESGAEDNEAGSAGAADAGVDDAIGPAGEEAVGEMLGPGVATGDGAGTKVAGEGALELCRGCLGGGDLWGGGTQPLR